ncbi:MAG: MBL fold metallo-hydrolase [Acholeplasmatales bacterium]|nr:MBL fold metallo-hydrolase [Acholeplasmatales bacterium]
MKCFTIGNYYENTYLINNGADAILVDPGEKLYTILDELKLFNIKAILLTHGHIDHIDGIKHYLDVPIYLSSEELEVLESDDYTLYSTYNLNRPFDTNKLDFHFLSDNDSFNIAGLNIKMIFTPGHTKGSCCYLINEKLLMSGDTLFQVGIGRTDLPTGDMNKMLESLDKLKKLPDDTIVYPGHGVETTIGFEKVYNPYFK